MHIFGLFVAPPPLPVSTGNSVLQVPTDCVGAQGWVTGIASHGSIILSRGRLVTVEFPGGTHLPYSTMQLSIEDI